MSKLKIKTKERRFETARDLYGIFFEDERVIIRTKLEKPSKIKGLALI